MKTKYTFKCGQVIGFRIVEKDLYRIFEDFNKKDKFSFSVNFDRKNKKIILNISKEKQ